MSNLSKKGDRPECGDKDPSVSLTRIGSPLHDSDGERAKTSSRAVSMNRYPTSGSGDEPVRHFLQYASRHMSEEELTESYQVAASELSDYRVNEAARTYLAILGYLVSISSAFMDAVDASTTSRPGNRVAFAVLFSCLIPAVLLSATIGGFPSRRSCHRILSRRNAATPESFSHKTRSALLMDMKSSEYDYFTS